MSLSPFHSLRSDFAPIISQKFERGRFLVIGADPEKLGRQFGETGRGAVVSESFADLAGKRRQDAAAAHFEIAVWFYPLERSDDDHMADELSHRADEIVLIPAPGSDVAQRRPQLVESFRRFGLVPHYGWDLSEIDPGAILLRHQPNGTADALVSALRRLSLSLIGHPIFFFPTITSAI